MSELNAFTSEIALKQSNATKWQDKHVVHVGTGQCADGESAKVHLAFRQKVLRGDFPCLGAKAAVKRLSYRVGVYKTLGDPATTEGVCYDLDEYFVFRDTERARYKDLFTTFVAVFTDTHIDSERSFHDLLWQQLQMIHDLDSKHYPWDPRVASDVSSSNFSFSIGTCAFFIVGLNPCSSRLSRRFQWPALVFNPGPQFEQIRELGKHAAMKAAIRKKDIALQGAINPTLADFGEGNVALTYSGMNTQDTKLCPFRVAKSNETLRRQHS
jgi:FPC/CPF motif-containing protein YcgG